MTVMRETDEDIDDVLDEICCDAANTLVELFDDAAKDVLADRLDYEDIDRMCGIVEDDIDEIVLSIAKRLNRPITAKELDEIKSLGVSEDTLLEEGVKIDAPLKDSDGREYRLVPEQPGQLTLFDEHGLPPAMVRVYLDKEVA